ncbi:hypothetical protein N657DRAFT_685424 [Parathielavia appendiculata]|uniref:Uncharacterized protein n=1 Tax=Parathielavia appendiculata TaxID=2587402 RepID=A0AAN6TQ81_9PEZI|nr:hypothetical protein N657DRAFT_685424 [Parathielavia appendiculata]
MTLIVTQLYNAGLPYRFKQKSCSGSQLSFPAHSGPTPPPQPHNGSALRNPPADRRYHIYHLAG